MTDRNREAVERGLKALAEEPVAPHLYPQVVAKLRNSTRKENPMKSFALKGAIAAAAFAVVVGGLVLIPATYSVTVGSLATVSFNTAGSPKPMDVVKALTIPNSQKMMTVEGDLATISIASRKGSASELKTAIDNGLKSVNGTINGLTVKVEPIKEERGGNALAAMTGGVIQIGVEGLSDAEIENAIASALSAHGMAVKQVQVSTTSPAPGQIERRIEIQGEFDDSTTRNFEFKFGDEPEGSERVIERRVIDKDGK